MRGKSFLVSALVVILLVAGACTSSGRGARESSIEVSIDDFMTARHVTREIQVASGGILTVTLGSNPTTGFRWTESAQITNKTILQQTDHKLMFRQGDIIGAPTTEVWAFKALKKGQTSVAMEYSRPWEGGEKGDWTFQLTVVVK